MEIEEKFLKYLNDRYEQITKDYADRLEECENKNDDSVMSLYHKLNELWHVRSKFKNMIAKHQKGKSEEQKAYEMNSKRTNFTGD